METILAILTICRVINIIHDLMICDTKVRNWWSICRERKQREIRKPFSISIHHLDTNPE